MPVILPRKTILPKSAAFLVAKDDRAPCVSVVIPTYNRAQLLPRAMESVLAQTFSDFELIVVDDGSADGSSDVARSYADPRVHVVQLTQNYGVARALNEGIATACGEFVAFLGDDDEWLPGLLDCLVARLRQADAPALAYSAAMWDLASGRRVTGYTDELAEGNILDGLFAGTAQVCSSACLARRSVLVTLGGFDELLGRSEDTDLWIRLSVASHQVAVVREPLAIIHGDHGLPRLMNDPVFAAVSLQRLHRRWGKLASARLGAEAYQLRRSRRLKRLSREHRKNLRRLMRAGIRSDAWRYVRQMLPTLPWGAPHIAQALPVVALGRWPYRLRRATKALRRTKSGDVTKAD